MFFFWAQRKQHKHYYLPKGIKVKHIYSLSIFILILSICTFDVAHIYLFIKEFMQNKNQKKKTTKIIYWILLLICDCLLKSKRKKQKQILINIKTECECESLMYIITIKYFIKIIPYDYDIII